MRLKCTCVCALYILLHIVVFTCGFNLNWKHALVFSDPQGQDGSYFGFTVALRQQSGKHWLVVGAPRGNSTYYKHGNIYQPGVVYQCSLERRDKCQHLIVDDSGNRRIPNYPGGPLQHNKNDSWLGGAIAVQNNGDGMVICAPRWKNSYHENYYLMNGMCYKTDNTDDPETSMEQILPLVDRNSQSKKVDNTDYFYYAYGEAGFTAHYPENSSEIVLGAPGVYDWRGTIIRIRDSNFPEGSPRRRRSLRAIDVPNPVKQSHRPVVPMNSYLGYSLSSGRFFSNEPRHQYVSGAPRASTYKGKVYLFDFPSHNDDDLSFIVQLEGTQMGEYFGGALCVADLNGDKLDDLVVAAPQYSLRATSSTELVGDEGRIYVYINSDSGLFTEKTGNVMIMGSRRYGARFGTAVANAGDLNWDGYEDIAVGAPYEGNGVVYIYHGNKNGINFEPAQIIRAESIDMRIKGFGISLSRGVDADGNQYNDIAVGAFDSGHAVVLRSHPIITFQPELKPNVKRVSVNKSTTFTATACLSYTGRSIIDIVEATITMQVDLQHGRANFVSKYFDATNNYTFNVKLRLKEPFCQDFKIETKPFTKDPMIPIDIVMRYDLVNNPNGDSTSRRRQASSNIPDGFCSHCPVLDVNQPKFIVRKVPYETGCKEDVCSPDLVVDAMFYDVKEGLILGERSTLRLDVVVVNLGEPAFLSRIHLLLPKDTPLVRMPPTCQESEEQPSAEAKSLVCDIGNPLHSSYTLNILMNAQEIPSDKKSLTYKVNVTSVGNEVNASNNVKELILPIATQADMTISGFSSQDQMVFVSQNKSFRKDLTLNHTFKVWNVGPSTVDTVKIEFEIPHQYDGPNGGEIFMQVFQPESVMQPSGTTIVCKPKQPFQFYTGEDPVVDDISFELEPPSDHDGTDDDDVAEVEEVTTIEKRSVTKTAIHTKENVWSSKYTASEAEYPSSEPTFVSPPSNRTLFLNCSSSKVDCFLVECIAGPFVPNKSLAVINFPFKPILEILEPSLENRDIILFSSRGKVTIQKPTGSVQPRDHRPDGVTVHTIFHGNIPEGSVAIWIIIVAVLCGVLILVIIATVLYKMGFFKREKKEELEALKEAEVNSGEVDAD